jgi:hypothetical protein
VALAVALPDKTDFLVVQAGAADKTEPLLAVQVQPGKEIPAEMVATMQMAGNAVAVAVAQVQLVRLVLAVFKVLQVVTV